MFSCGTEPCSFHVLPSIQARKSCKAHSYQQLFTTVGKANTTLCLIGLGVSGKAPWIWSPELIADAWRRPGCKGLSLVCFSTASFNRKPQINCLVLFFPSEISCTPAKLQSSVQALLSWSCCCLISCTKSYGCSFGVWQTWCLIFLGTDDFDALPKFPARLLLCSGTQHFSKSGKEGGRCHVYASPLNDVFHPALHSAVDIDLVFWCGFCLLLNTNQVPAISSPLCHKLSEICNEWDRYHMRLIRSIFRCDYKGK